MNGICMVTRILMFFSTLGIRCRLVWICDGVFTCWRRSLRPGCWAGPLCTVLSNTAINVVFDSDTTFSMSSAHAWSTPQGWLRKSPWLLFARRRLPVSCFDNQYTFHGSNVYWCATWVMGPPLPPDKIIFLFFKVGCDTWHQQINMSINLLGLRR